MRARLFAIGMVLAVLFFVPRASTPDLSAAPPAQGETTLADQVELSVTVYNSDLALIRDVRNLQLPAGSFDLRFMDIAATVNPATVHFRSLTEPARLDVLEQNYEYDLLEPDKLLRKYVGREVTLVRNGKEEVKARLLSYNTGPVWQIGDEIVTGMHADHIRFPELPGNLYSRPTLIWTLQNDGAARHRVEASYLARALKWNADYVLTIGRDDTSGDVDGWVTLTNGSGTAFNNAKLQLVAGELNRVQTHDAVIQGFVAERSSPAAVGRMVQEAFSEYHLYTLPRKTTINNNETKQVRMLSGTKIPVEKRYVVNGQAFYYRNRTTPGAPLKDPVQVYYEFRNEERGGLGGPMPAGIVRVYQSDSTGAVQFAGEDRIGHTPKDETLKLRIGSAFDVVCERNQTDFQKLAASTYEMEFVIELRNRKPVPISVDVNEPISGTWQMLQASHDWTKTSAWAARFTVPIAANSTAELKYRVRVTY
jgi:hypothetical protein